MFYGEKISFVQEEEESNSSLVREREYACECVRRGKKKRFTPVTNGAAKKNDRMLYAVFIIIFLDPVKHRKQGSTRQLAS